MPPLVGQGVLDAGAFLLELAYTAVELEQPHRSHQRRDERPRDRGEQHGHSQWQGTTAISMATGLLRPDNGTAYVCGHNIWSTQQFAAKAQFGLLADGLPVFDRLTGREYLNYLGAIREIPSETVRKRSDELLDVLELREAENKFIVDYSAGMTKKILLAGALLHRPRLLVLDEPLEAVDPVSAQIIRQILTHFVRGGGTVVISSHVMELVEGICDHVAIIANGEVLRAGSLDDVRQGRKLTDVFVELVGGGTLDNSSLSWLSESEDPNA